MENLCVLRQLSADYLGQLEENLSKKTVNEAELTALCLIPHLLGPSFDRRLNPSREIFPFQRLILFKDDNEKNQHYVTSFLKNYSWKGYSDRIRRALYQWSLGRYPLMRFKRVPTPLELLEVQASGQRVVTVFSKPEEWKQMFGEKNAFEFVLHDLVHADHFFEKKDWCEGQTQFYRYVLESWNHPLTVKTRTHCPEQFDYLISDMNSHPKHLFQTFEALMMIAEKKSLGIPSHQRLSQSQEKSFRRETQEFFRAL